MKRTGKPPEQPRRECSNPLCTAGPTRYGRYCRACATAATQRWREQHGDDLRARERARVFSDEQQAVRRARGYVSALVRRGKILPENCEACGEPQTSPHWDDPRRPKVVRWFCVEHRREHADATEAVRAGLAALSMELAEIAALPQAVLEALHAAASRGLDGTGAAPTTLRYQIALRFAYRALAGARPL